jgi:LysM repeat protein
MIFNNTNIDDNSFIVQSHSTLNNKSPLQLLFESSNPKLKNILNISKVLASVIGATILLSTINTSLENENTGYINKINSHISQTDMKNYVNTGMKEYLAEYQPSSKEISDARLDYELWDNNNQKNEIIINVKKSIPLEKYKPTINNKSNQFNFNLRSLKTPQEENMHFFKDQYVNKTPSFKDLIEISKPYGVDPIILQGIMLKESQGDCSKTSSKKAKGCFQFLKNTATEFSLNKRTNGFAAADTAARYMLWLNKTINGNNADVNNLDNLEYSLAAYNAGKGRVLETGTKRIPQFKETINYVNDITGYINGTKHYVQKGELIHDIAQRYNLSEKSLARSNLFNIKNNNDLKWGSFVNIENKDNSIIKIKVTKGLSLYQTSIKTGVNLDEIAKYNNISDPKFIKIGQVIYIPPLEKKNIKLNNTKII